MTEPRWLNADERRAWLALVSINTLLPAALDTKLHTAGKLSLFDYTVLAMLSEAEKFFQSPAPPTYTDPSGHNPSAASAVA